MANDQFERNASGVTLNDILFMLFRKKWIIVSFSILGLAAAIIARYSIPPSYESQAKLLVRYVVERSAIDSIDGQPKSVGDTFINSEVEILTSRDLATDVATSLVAERSVERESTVSKNDEINDIQTGLSVMPLKNSNIIMVAYKHGDPAWATRTLDELIKRYLAKHLEVHRSVGAFEFVTQQSSEVKTQLGKTEEELKNIKTTEGIISLTDSATALNSEYAQALTELRTTETQLAEQEARIKEMARWVSDAGSKAEKMEEVPREAIQRYQAIAQRIAKLRQVEFDNLAKFTDESSVVSRTRSQLNAAEVDRDKLEKKYPSLALSGANAESTDDPRATLITERSRLASLEAKSSNLKLRVEELRKAMQRFSEVGPKIAQLERKRNLEEENYKYYQASLERARIDEALDPSKMPNISVVQRPSGAFRVSSKLEKKLIFGLLAGGVVLGVAIALLLELMVDRSVKRPMEFAAHLQIPMLCWVPLIGNNSRLLLRDRNGRKGLGGENGSELTTNDAPWEPGHFISRFAEEICDRLLLFFEIKNATHKPKLIAVTGCSVGGGVSTVAGGLATALSQTGEGRVLLVDMHDADTKLHPFFEGCPIFSLSDALVPGGAMCAAAENLYLATAALPLNEGRSIAPRAFYDMVPRFHASDFDYVVFDMPPMDESRSTLSIARFMDKVLLVVESEKNSRDLVQRSFGELRSANVNVSAILNKTRSYTPRWLGADC
jgi:uncharacterized protein involved in exopolysaccharide biosynthesis/Mrp family chromosome partitioning ATPase